ncbi:MerR family transcriptional regulator [Chimaeribacter arupi]|uniref:MerR family DNA-binding transcriptional regulator n=1 Tax=Chimaeribacter arupi TaxID=2060066 RepID=UPI000C7A8567|nr:MerR family transcriptional regulator [Chimaeribacter arupi]
MRELDIGDVAARSGLTPATLRFYEEKGLIRSVGRHGLRRQYRADVLPLLALIVLGQRAGFSLLEIAAMLGNERAQLAAKADEVDQQIRHLEKVRDGLRHAAACPASGHLLCPLFNRLLRAARRGARKKSGR